MKEARQAVVQCIEHLIELGVVGGGDSTLPQLWDTFTSYLQKYPHLLTCDRRGCVGLDTRNENTQCLLLPQDPSRLTKCLGGG